MDPVNDIVTLDITPSPTVLTTDDLVCYKCHKSNANLMRFQCKCDIPVHIECAIKLKRKGYKCPTCGFTADMRQTTPESRLLPRVEPSLSDTPVRSSRVFIVIIIFTLACILSYIIYNYAVAQ